MGKCEYDGQANAPPPDKRELDNAIEGNYESNEWLR